MSGGRLENNARMKELIVYISQKSQGDKKFGATKLNKILFYSDYLSFARRGQSITGHDYQRLPQGPAPRRLLPLRAELIEEDRISLLKRDYGGLQQDTTVALTEPDLSIFDGEDIAIVDEIIEACWGMTARQISCESHKFIGWRLAETGESIPYEVTLAARREPMACEVKRGGELEEQAEEVLALCS